MEREPHRQQHDLDRHHRHRAPRHHAKEGEQDSREHVHVFRAAVREDRVARAHHVLGIDRVADHLQREVRLHARADVERAVGEERPAAVRQLDAAQITGDLLFEFEVRRFAEIVDQQHVFGRNRRVGFEFVDPMAVRLLRGQDRIGRARDRCVERVPALHGRRRCGCQCVRHGGRVGNHGSFGQVRRRIGGFGQRRVERLGVR
ncbi:hypothetical protein OKW30_007747 [Paraburkholderia sp. Clong3]